MQYLLMITMDEQAYAALPPDVLAESTQAYEKFGAEMGERGVLVGGARLRPTSDATCVQVRDGKTLTFDGPFAETKEQLGGYYLVDVADLDEAIAVAAKIPGAAHGTIEVRPIWYL